MSTFGIPDPGRAEQWAPIPGFPHYEASDQGRVRSLDRLVPTGAYGGQRLVVGHVLNHWLSTNRPNGYHIVALGKHAKRAVHQLVLAAFVGPQPDGLVSRHLDDDRDNNRLENLAYGTQSENNLDAVRNGHNLNSNKTHCPKGHPYSGDNLHVRPCGRKRDCRKCSNSRPGPRTRKRLAELAAAKRVAA